MCFIVTFKVFNVIYLSVQYHEQSRQEQKTQKSFFFLFIVSVSCKRVFNNFIHLKNTINYSMSYTECSLQCQKNVCMNSSEVFKNTVICVCMVYPRVIIRARLIL